MKLERIGLYHLLNDLKIIINKTRLEILINATIL